MRSSKEIQKEIISNNNFFKNYPLGTELLEAINRENYLHAFHSGFFSNHTPYSEEEALKSYENFKKTKS